MCVDDRFLGYTSHLSERSFGTRAFGELAYHDYEGVALDLDERPRLQRDLGTKNLMLLRNHGTLTVGATCAQAFIRMYFLERSCTMQVRTRMLGGDDYPTAEAVIEKNAELARG